MQRGADRVVKVRSALAPAGPKPPPRSTGRADFRLETHAFYWFSRILSRRNRVLNGELRRFGLDYPRWRVMAVLNEHPGCSMQQLADHTGVDRTTLAHTVALMASQGLLTKRARKTDRRSIMLSLTPHGRDLLVRILPTVLGLSRQSQAGFTAPEIRTLFKLLQRMADNIGV
jgi:MarR family transcriptional regulator, organic hydroperoxide resistance regulator